MCRDHSPERSGEIADKAALMKHEQMAFGMASDDRQTRAARGVQSLDIVQPRLLELHDTRRLSWREIAARDERSGIPARTLCAMAQGGRDPKGPKSARILGLPEIIEITVTRDLKEGSSSGLDGDVERRIARVHAM